jgi:hypothetical protein
MGGITGEDPSQERVQCDSNEHYAAQLLAAEIRRHIPDFVVTYELILYGSQ